MTGRVIRVNVEPGQEVAVAAGARISEGDLLVVVDLA
jgi:biotin carboxyl carrier protein